jgi:outer membrane protein TolC
MRLASNTRPGTVSQKDVLQAGVALSRLSEHLIMFEREADSARADLNTLMGRPPDQPLEVTGQYGVLDTLPSQNELLAVAARNRPELLALEVMKKQGTHKVQLAENRFQTRLLHLCRLYVDALRITEP